MRGRFFKNAARACALATVLVLANCGKAPQPVPQIAPPPTTNPGFGGGGGAGCGGATGIPLARPGATGFMYSSSVYGQSATGTIGLNLYSIDQYYGSQDITGQASINLQTHQGNLQFCASSYQITGGTGGMLSPGRILQALGYQSYAIQMTLWQQTQVPVQWNGGITYIPAMVTVQLPQTTAANGRVQGQIIVLVQSQGGGQPQYHQLNAGY